MSGGRYFIHRSIKAVSWTENPDGTRTGIIRVQHFTDATHLEPIGKPAYYKGTIPAKQIGAPEDSYRDALEIISQKNEIEAPKPE